MVGEVVEFLEFVWIGVGYVGKWVMRGGWCFGVLVLSI